jgi:hypothetical protein
MKKPTLLRSRLLSKKELLQLRREQKRVWARVVANMKEAIRRSEQISGADLAIRINARSSDRAAAKEPLWQPIQTAPKMVTILLFAVTDIAEDGSVRNWNMATGSWHTGYEDERSKAQGYTTWTWAGRQLNVYDVQPTHWMPLPKPPKD